ncbi:hypothetical protein TNCV_2404241 [Trichonephila clavipes]|nr:hypothetical protein TNCV_2404241 [Trichonephila clavipes]
MARVPMWFAIPDLYGAALKKPSSGNVLGLYKEKQNKIHPSSRLGDVVGLSLALCTKGCGFYPSPKSVDFPDAENRQRPCRMRHEKNPLSVRLAWML